MSGWDPLTGRCVTSEDVDDLIRAAGGTAEPQTSDLSQGLCIKLMMGSGDETIQQFFTSDVYEAQSRICAFFEAVDSACMHVKIECSHLAAIAFKDAQNVHRVQTSWMDKSVMTSAPATVYYPASEFSAWARNISACFLNLLKIKNNVDLIREVAERRTSHFAGVVDATPATPWLEAEAPSMMQHAFPQQGVVPGFA